MRLTFEELLAEITALWADLDVWNTAFNDSEEEAVDLMENEIIVKCGWTRPEYAAECDLRLEGN